MKLRLRGSPFLKDYDFDLWLMPRPDADNAAVGKYDIKVLPQVYCLRLFCYPENRKRYRGIAKKVSKENKKK